MNTDIIFEVCGNPIVGTIAILMGLRYLYVWGIISGEWLIFLAMCVIGVDVLMVMLKE